MNNAPDILRSEKDLVIRVALEDKSWMSNPSAVGNLGEGEVAGRIRVVAVPTPDLFGGARFYVATDPTEKPGSRTLIVVVGPRDQAQPMRSREDYPRFIKERCLRVQSIDGAWEIAQNYVRLFGYAYPQYWNAIKFLESYDQIPLKPGEVLPDSLRSLIQSRKLEQKQDGFFVRVFTWTQLGGQLKRFEISIASNGAFEAREEQLALDLGQVWLPK
jgi:hypothetical protein